MHDSKKEIEKPVINRTKDGKVYIKRPYDRPKDEGLPKQKEKYPQGASNIISNFPYNVDITGS